MQTYRATGSVPLPEIEVGDTFEADLSAELEADLIRTGRVEIMPRRYRVTGNRRVFEVDPDGHFEAALSVAQEGQLVAAGHIARVESPAKKLGRGGKAEAIPAPTVPDPDNEKEGPG